MEFGNDVPQRSPETRSGMTCASAPSIVDTTRFLTSPWAPAGASGRTSTIDASGARSVMARNAPLLTGPCGSSVDFRATNTPAPATASEEFTTPGTWGLEPSKSATTWSPSTTSFRRISTGSRRPASKNSR